MNLLKIAPIFILLLLLGCKNSESQQVETKTSYELLTLKKDSADVITSYTASIQGKQDIEIYPQVSGYLSQIKVKEGDVVKKGDVLFIIEQTPYVAALEAAKASVLVGESTLANAELNYNNTLTLRGKGVVSEAELLAVKNSFDGAKAQLELALAQMKAAQINLDFTVIKSPSNGVVGTLPYRQGSLVSPTRGLTVVSDNSEMYVYFSMSENQVLDLIDKFGSMDEVLKNFPKVGLELNNGSIYSEKGKIESVSGIIDPSTGSLSVRAVFPNSQRKLLSGGAGNILLENRFEDVILIPKSATYELQEKICVYRIVDNKATSTIITVEKGPNDREYIVGKGLNVGDVVIAQGAGLVREGTLINQ